MAKRKAAAKFYVSYNGGGENDEIALVIFLVVSLLGILIVYIIWATEQKEKRERERRILKQLRHEAEKREQFRKATEQPLSTPPLLLPDEPKPEPKPNPNRTEPYPVTQLLRQLVWLIPVKATSKAPLREAPTLASQGLPLDPVLRMPSRSMD